MLLSRNHNQRRDTSDDVKQPQHLINSSSGGSFESPYGGKLHMKKLIIRWRIKKLMKSKNLADKVEAYKLATMYAGMALDLEGGRF